jgi:hypothetical protein
MSASDRFRINRLSPGVEAGALEVLVVVLDANAEKLETDGAELTTRGLIDDESDWSQSVGVDRTAISALGVGGTKPTDGLVDGESEDIVLDTNDDGAEDGISDE